MKTTTQTALVILLIAGTAMAQEARKEHRRPPRDADSACPHELDGATSAPARVAMNGAISTNGVPAELPPGPPPGAPELNEDGTRPAPPAGHGPRGHHRRPAKEDSSETSTESSSES